MEKNRGVGMQPDTDREQTKKRRQNDRKETDGGERVVMTVRKRQSKTRKRQTDRQGKRERES